MAQPRHPSIYQCCWACGTGPSASSPGSGSSGLCPAHPPCWALGAHRSASRRCTLYGRNGWCLWVGPRKATLPNTEVHAGKGNTGGLLPIYKPPRNPLASPGAWAHLGLSRSLSVFPYHSHSKVNPKWSSLPLGEQEHLANCGDLRPMMGVVCLEGSAP